MSEPFIGEIRAFGFNFAPRSWASCDGQMMAISQNTSLFSLIGTIYGGDGRTTFALPDLRGRSMINDGAGPGLTPFQIGQHFGSERITLGINNLPSHNHIATLHGEAKVGNSANPKDRMLAKTSTDTPYIAQDLKDNVSMDPNSIIVSNTGGNQSFPILAPRLAVNICIALHGVFPSRN